MLQNSEQPLKHRASAALYIGRHWRGELPLWIAYFVNGILITTTMLVVAAQCSQSPAPRLTEFSPAGYGCFALAVGLIGAWQGIGILRSAKRTFDTRTHLFGIVMPAIAVVSTAYVLLAFADHFTTVALSYLHAGPQNPTRH